MTEKPLRRVRWKLMFGFAGFWGVVTLYAYAYFLWWASIALGITLFGSGLFIDRKHKRLEGKVADDFEKNSAVNLSPIRNESAGRSIGCAVVPATSALFFESEYTARLPPRALTKKKRFSSPAWFSLCKRELVRVVEVKGAMSAACCRSMIRKRERVRSRRRSRSCKMSRTLLPFIERVLGFGVWSSGIDVVFNFFPALSKLCH